MRQTRCTDRLKLAERRRLAQRIWGVKVYPFILDKHKAHRAWPGQLVYGDHGFGGGDMSNVCPTRRGVGEDRFAQWGPAVLHYAVQWFDHYHWNGQYPAWGQFTRKTAHWRERYPLPDDNEYWDVSLSNWIEFGGGLGGRDVSWSSESPLTWRLLV